MTRNLLILISLAIFAFQCATAQEMSAGWYRQKDLAWDQARIRYPECAKPGPFKSRMLALDAWAKDHDPQLYYDPTKPLRLAEMVASERIKIEVGRVIAQTDAHEAALLEVVENKRAVQFRVLGILALVLPFLGFLGSLDANGIRRRGLWFAFGIAAVVITVFTPRGPFSSPDVLDHSINVSLVANTLAMALCAYAIGMRASNSGYKRWMAAVSASPLIGLPMVINLLFSRGKRRSSAETSSSPTPDRTTNGALGEQ